MHRAFTYAFDAAEPRVAKRLAERVLRERSAIAGADAERTNQVDEKSAEDARCEVLASAVLFVANKLAGQQPGGLLSQRFPVYLFLKSKHSTKSRGLILDPLCGRCRGSTMSEDAGQARHRQWSTLHPQ